MYLVRIHLDVSHTATVRIGFLKTIQMFGCSVPAWKRLTDYTSVVLTLGLDHKYVMWLNLKGCGVVVGDFTFKTSSTARHFLPGFHSSYFLRVNNCTLMHVSLFTSKASHFYMQLWGGCYLCSLPLPSSSICSIFTQVIIIRHRVEVTFQPRKTKHSH